LQLALACGELNAIIKRRMAEAKVIESEENFHSLFENMLDGFAYCKMILTNQGQPFDFVFLEVNNAFERITSLKREDLVGRKATKAFSGIKEGNPELFNIVGKAALTGEKARFEVYFKPLNIWLAISVYSPRKGYFAIVCENISDRKKAERELFEREELLAKSQEIAHLGSWELDLEKDRLLWSDEVYRIFGLKPREFGATYEAFLSHVHPDDRQAVDEAYSGSVEDGKCGYEIEHRVIRKDTGELRIVHERCSHIRNNEGKIIRSIGMVHDITERRKAEDALKESEERLQLKLDSVLFPDVEIEDQELSNILDVPSLQSMMNYLYAVTQMGFALIDLKGKVLVGTGWQEICTNFHRVNARSCKNCIESDLELTRGLKRGEIRLYQCKNKMWDVVTPLFIGNKYVGNLFFGQFFFEHEQVNRNTFIAQAKKYKFNQETYLSAFDRVPRFSREKVDYLMIFYAELAEMLSKLSYANLKLAKALSNQKVLQDKLEAKAQEVEEYATQMEELAQERADQLKTAERFAAIGQTAGMVGHDIRNPLQSILGDIYLARSEVEALSNAEAKASLNESLNDIEDAIEYVNKIVADLQDFARPLKPAAVDVDLQKVTDDVLSKISVPKSIRVSCSIDEKAQTVLADELLLRRVITNLIINAVQAMPEGGSLAIRARRQLAGVVVSVQDTGNGIPEDIKPKLFTPLFTTKSKGQGFGLAVVKRLTESMGGEVTFQSSVGEGTTFHLKFPSNAR
jgi:PAS domain S-box-containing protein